DVLAAAERPQDVVARRLDPADQLRDDLDLRVVQHLRGVGGEQRARNVHITRLVEVPDADLLDHQPRVDLALDRPRVLQERADRTGADHSAAQDADRDGLWLMRHGIASPPVSGLAPAGAAGRAKTAVERGASIISLA